MNDTEREHLKDVQRDIATNLLPVIVLVAVLEAVGILGNTMAFIFYAFKTTRSSTVILIACLAVVDMIVCIICTFNIFEMFVNVMFTYNFVCKLTHLFGLWSIITSGLILWMIAIDRHRKICVPFGKQVTLKTIKYALAAILIFGLVVSVRNFVIFDTNEVNVAVIGTNHTVTGHYCTTSDKASLKAGVAISNVIDFLIMIIIWVTLVVAYTHIIITLIRVRRKKRTLQSDAKIHVNVIYNPKFSNTADGEKSSIKVYEADDSGIVKTETSCILSDEQPSGYSLPVQIATVTSTRTRNGNEEVAPSPNAQEPELQKQTHDRKRNIVNIGAKFNTFHQKDTQNSIVSQSGCLDGTHQEQSMSCEFSGVQTSTSKDNVETSVDNVDAIKIDEKGNVGSHRKRSYKMSKGASERSLTFQMFTVSFVFIACFTPYFIVKILMRIIFQAGEEYELDLASQFALRLPYMNSVFNPIVYIIFNSKFREFLKNILFSLFLRCLNK